MSSRLSPYAWMLCVVVGIGFATFGAASLSKTGKFAHDRNTFAIQRSAYGRLLARLSESTIDRVWHLGVEQIVPHNISGVGHGMTAAIAEPGAEPKPHKPALDRAKGWFDDMRVVKYTRTNPYSLNDRHLATVKRDIEEMLLRSYKMDPGHYGVYNSYHLFLTTHDFGGTEASREHAKKVANATLAEVFQEDEDPEPWLTAASAAMNLFLLESEEAVAQGHQAPVELLREYRQKIGFCLQRFDELQKRSEQNGTWDNLSRERQFEITHRYRFSNRTFEQFDAMIARAEGKESPAPESELAEKNAPSEE